MIPETSLTRSILLVIIISGVVVAGFAALRSWRRAARLQHQSIVHQAAVGSLESAYSNAVVALNTTNEAQFRHDMGEIVAAVAQLNSLEDQELPADKAHQVERFSLCINGLQRVHDLILLGKVKPPVSIPSLDQCSENTPTTSK